MQLLSGFTHLEAAQPKKTRHHTFSGGAAASSSSSSDVRFSGIRTNQLKQAIGHYTNIVLQHENSLKYMTAIVASFLLILSRIFTAWHTAWGMPDKGEDKRFAIKEAYRTTLREFGGFTFSYALLKVLEKASRKSILKQVGLRDPKLQTEGPLTNQLPSIRYATKALKNHLRQLSNGGFIQDRLYPRKIYHADFQASLEAGNYTRFAQRYQQNGLFRRWVNLFQKQSWSGKLPTGLSRNLIQQGKPVLDVFKPYLKNAPMLVGGLTALCLSGFFLEWLTLNKMDTITGWLSGHKGPDPVSRYSLTNSTYSPAAMSLVPRLQVSSQSSPGVLTSWDMYTKFVQPYDLANTTKPY